MHSEIHLSLPGFLFGHGISVCSQISGRYLSDIVQNAANEKKVCYYNHALNSGVSQFMFLAKRP